jgi:hypothetical protein
MDTVIRPLAERGAKFRQTVGWIPINEPEHMLRAGYVSRAAFEAFAKETVAVFRAVAPRQPIGVAHSDIESMLALARVMSPAFYMLHHYSPSLVPPPGDLLVSSMSETSAPKKPIYIGEFSVNYPPGGDIERFVQWAGASGYASAWSWSLLNRTTVTGDRADDVEPQYELASQYANAMSRMRSELTGVDRVAARFPDWNEASLSNLRGRAAESERRRTYYAQQRRENMEWLERIEQTLTSKEVERRTIRPDLETADARMKENDTGLKAAQARKATQEKLLADALKRGDKAEIEKKRATLAIEEAEVSKFRVALKESTRWHDEKKRHIEEVDREIDKQLTLRPQALRLYRTHDYLLAEATAGAEDLPRLVSLIAQEGNKKR